MRARDFLIDATPVTTPIVSSKPTPSSSSDAFRTAARNSANPADEMGLTRMHLTMDGQPTGTFPPEIEQLKSAGGMFDTSKVTPDFIKMMATKYNKSGSPFKVSKDFPANHIKWGGSLDPKFMVFDANGLEQVRKQTIKAMTDYNKYNSPRDKFWNPDRATSDNALPGHRGAAKGVENLAKKFEPRDINFYLESYKWAVQKQLISPITSDQWLMILLTEGRSDFGFNIGQWMEQRGPADVKFEEQLKTMGLVNNEQTGFIALVRAKQGIAKHTGKPFYQAWNGGAANLDNYNNQVAAVKDPRNKPLLDLITQALA
jgi:hypothetical protein